jgi:hypothetical protein
MIRLQVKIQDDPMLNARETGNAGLCQLAAAHAEHLLHHQV